MSDYKPTDHADARSIARDIDAEIDRINASLAGKIADSHTSGRLVSLSLCRHWTWARIVNDPMCSHPERCRGGACPRDPNCHD